MANPGNYFKKGNKSSKGRPKGSRNKRIEFIEKLKEIDISLLPEQAIKDNFQDILDEFAKLKGRDKIVLGQKFFEWIRPLLARTEHTGKDGEELTINIIHYDKK